MEGKGDRGEGGQKGEGLGWVKGRKGKRGGGNDDVEEGEVNKEGVGITKRGELGKG